MSLTSVPKRTVYGLWAIALLAAPACVVSEEGPGLTSQAAADFGHGLVPSFDIASADVLGVGDKTYLHRNLDDGTSFADADNGQSMIRGIRGKAVGRAHVGYAGAPAGMVTGVKVSFRARPYDSVGTVQIHLYDGDTLIASGAAHSLSGSWANYSDTFTGLAVADANTLSTEIELRNSTPDEGSHRVTQVWIEVAYGGAGQPDAAPSEPDAAPSEPDAAPSEPDAAPPEPDAAIEPDPESPVGGPFLPYSLDSFFRSPVPANAPIDAESADGIAFVKAHPEQKDPYPIIRGLGSNKWGTVYVEGSCDDPVWKLTGNVPSKVSFLKTQGFHAPAILGSILTGTSDSPFVVMDRCGVPAMPEGLSVWAAGAAASGNDTIDVSAAGAFQHDSNGLDQRNPRSDSSLNFRSRGAIPDAMVIRKDRLEWAIANGGDLGHVLHMFWVETATADGHVHPMIGEEGDKLGWGAEGIRIRIKPSVDLESRNLSPGGLVVARTLQRYGAYIGDNSGSGTALKAEQNYGQWGNLLDAHALRGLSWDDFEFVERGYQP